MSKGYTRLLSYEEEAQITGKPVYRADRDDYVWPNGMATLTIEEVSDRLRQECITSPAHTRTPADI